MFDWICFYDTTRNKKKKKYDRILFKYIEYLMERKFVVLLEAAKKAS